MIYNELKSEKQYLQNVSQYQLPMATAMKATKKTTITTTNNHYNKNNNSNEIVFQFIFSPNDKLKCVTEVY